MQNVRTRTPQIQAFATLMIKLLCPPTTPRPQVKTASPPNAFSLHSGPVSQKFTFYYFQFNFSDKLPIGLI